MLNLRNVEVEDGYRHRGLTGADPLTTSFRDPEHRRSTKLFDSAQPELFLGVAEAYQYACLARGPFS